MSARTLLMAAATAGPPGASLNLSFMSGTLDPRITFTRASTATYFDATGTMQTAATNAPRWDYSAGTLRGLLMEEARTNLLLNSATLGTQSVAVTAQPYTLSFYGTGTITKSGTAAGALVGTGAGQRVSQTFTPTAGTLTCTVTGSVLNAQLEAGGFVTSYISTAGAAATRAQDGCVIQPGNMGWFVTAGGTWFAEFTNLTPVSANEYVITYNAAGSRMPLYVNGSSNLGIWDAVGFVGSANAVSLGVVSKGTTSWLAGAAKVCLNAGAVASSGALTTGFGDAAAVGLALLQLPGQTGGMTGYLRAMRYWPRVLTDIEMQQVTR